jgi:alanine dehydrogenase
MIVGMPSETKEGEARVALLPPAVQALVEEGHEVRVQSGSGEGIGASDDDYADAGAAIVNAIDAWEAELVVKVKEMQATDFRIAPAGRTIFSFHHLPREPQRTRALAARGDTAIAFEMVRNAQGEFPMLSPMSTLAGRIAMETAWRLLPAAPRKVVILGAGHAGMSAARAAARLRSRVVILTRSPASRDAASEQGFPAELATPEAIAQHLPDADMVVGAVFVPGAPTPRLISRAMVQSMQRGAVLVDISIDAGGVSETSRPTSHSRPTYVDEGVIHYCVPNIPAAVPVQGAAALSGAVLPYVRELARMGIDEALGTHEDLRHGTLLWKGQVTHEGIAAEAGLPFSPLVVEAA